MIKTFEETINRLETDTIGNYEMQEILENLRDIYAPIIKMTNEEYTDLRHYRVHYPLDKFIYDFGELHGTQLSEKDLAQAWLHPETIKIKE